MKKIFLLSISLFSINLLANSENYAKQVYKLYNQQIQQSSQNWSSAADLTTQALMNTMDKKLNNKNIIIKNLNGEDKNIDSKSFYYFNMSNGQLVSSEEYSSIFQIKEKPTSNLIKLKYNVDYGKVIIWLDNGASAVLNVNNDLTIDWDKILNSYKFIGGKLQ